MGWVHVAIAWNAVWPRKRATVLALTHEVAWKTLVLGEAFSMVPLLDT